MATFLVRESLGISSTTLTPVRPRSYRIRWNNAKSKPLRRSRSSKVIDFDANRKLIYDFLLVININLPAILHAPFPIL